MTPGNVPSLLFISKKLFYTLLLFGGRHPLCGKGVTSSIDEIRSPACCNAEIADSRPGPGPFILISISRTPLRMASFAHRWAACCAAKGVLLRDPLKPMQPDELEQTVSPSISVIVINVLLNVALICARALTTFFLAFRRVFAISLKVLVQQLQLSSLISIHLSARFLYTLLAGNRLPRSLAGPGVALSILPANRKTLSMTKTAVTDNITQPGDILLNLSAKLPADNVITVYNLRNPAELIFGKLTGLDRLFYPRLLQNLGGGILTYAINMGQGDPYGFIVWNINTKYTRHNSSFIS